MFFLEMRVCLEGFSFVLGGLDLFFEVEVGLWGGLVV